VSVLTGVPKRTLQVWRKGFFVPALSPEWTGHAERELYGLGDVVTVHVMRRLIAVGVDRGIVARVGEELPESSDGWMFRRLAAAEPAWWCLVVTNPGWATERDEIISLWPEDQLNAELLAEYETSEQDELIWLSGAGESPFAVAVPISKYSAVYVAKADAWRRQRRIAEKHWPPWM
jgi:hypothetical protein